MNDNPATGRPSRVKGEGTPRLDDARQARIVKLASQRMPRNAIAREVGVSASTVTKYAHAAGFSFDRSATKRATEARQIDNQASRAELAARMLADLEESRQLMRSLPKPTDLRSVEQRTRAQANQARQFADITRAAPITSADPAEVIREAMVAFTAGVTTAASDAARLAAYEAKFGVIEVEDDNYGREGLD